MSASIGPSIPIRPDMNKNEITLGEASQNKDTLSVKVRKRWTSEEDEILKEVVSKYGNKNWRNIAFHLVGKTPKQCRERWSNQLDPKVRHGPLTEFEWKELCGAYLCFKQNKNKWAKIVQSKKIPGRTANQLKNLWNTRNRQHISKDENKRGRDPMKNNQSALNDFDALTIKENNISSKDYSVDSSTESVSSRNVLHRYLVPTSDLTFTSTMNYGIHSSPNIPEILNMSSKNDTLDCKHGHIHPCYLNPTNSTQNHIWNTANDFSIMNDAIRTTKDYNQNSCIECGCTNTGNHLSTNLYNNFVAINYNGMNFEESKLQRMQFNLPGCLYTVRYPAEQQIMSFPHQIGKSCPTNFERSLSSTEDRMKSTGQSIAISGWPFFPPIPHASSLHPSYSDSTRPSGNPPFMVFSPTPFSNLTTNLVYGTYPNSFASGNNIGEPHLS